MSGYDKWKSTEPDMDDHSHPICARCARPADAFDVTGNWLCADCMFDEAEPATTPRKESRNV